MLRYRALVPFLRRHGADLFAEVRAAYVDTLSRVLSSHFRAYLAALDAAKVPFAALDKQIWAACRWTALSA